MFSEAPPESSGGATSTRAGFPGKRNRTCNHDWACILRKCRRNCARRTGNRRPNQTTSHRTRHFGLSEIEYAGQNNPAYHHRAASSVRANSQFMAVCHPCRVRPGVFNVETDLLHADAVLHLREGERALAAPLL